ncbi:MAG: aminoacyl-tRNA hydrolase [Phycisphaeraceae bacterium]|nr:aminoacyl-tRNA hydrolase [Phycisphaeraceae bacterium]
MATPETNTTQIAPGVEIPEAALSFTFSRSSGPGGQNVNKVNSRATLTVPVSALREALPPYAVHRLKVVAARYVTQEGLQISAGDSRSQAANRRACLERLREVIVESLRRPKARKKTKPSARARQRRLDAKKHRSKIKSLRKGKDL